MKTDYYDDQLAREAGNLLKAILYERTNPPNNEWNELRKEHKLLKAKIKIDNQK